jgi:hypothetical protein
VTGAGQDAAVALRDADGHPVRVGRENDDVIVQVAKTAPRGRIRLDAAARQEFLRAVAAAGPPVGARGDDHPGADGGCLDVEAGVAEWLERFCWDLRDPVRISGREFRSLCLEEVRALGYADTNPAVLLRREDDGTVFEVAIGVTVREVRRAPVPLVSQGAQGSPDVEGSGGD